MWWSKKKKDKQYSGYVGYTGQRILIEEVKEDMRRLEDVQEKQGNSEWFWWYIGYRDSYKQFKINRDKITQHYTKD